MQDKLIGNENDIIFIWPCCIHTLYAPEQGKRLIFQADISLLNQIKQMVLLHTQLTPLTIVTPENSPNTHSLIQKYLLEIAEEYEKDSPYIDLAIYGKILEILSLLAQNANDSTDQFNVAANKQQEYTEKFMYICEYIRQHCSEDLCLDDVAALAGFSKYHFSRLFKQFAGASFYKYLNQQLQ